MHDEQAPAAVSVQDEVAGAVEHLRVAEAQLARRRQRDAGLIESDRIALRHILESADLGIEATPSMLAGRLRLSPASVTVVVDRLVAGGWVAVTPHPRDRRKKLVEPVDPSLDPAHIDPLTRRVRTLSAALPTDEARIIKRFLHELTVLVQNPDLRP